MVGEEPVNEVFERWGALNLDLDLAALSFLSMHAQDSTGSGLVPSWCYLNYSFKRY